MFRLTVVRSTARTKWSSCRLAALSKGLKRILVDAQTVFDLRRREPAQRGRNFPDSDRLPAEAKRGRAPARAGMKVDPLRLQLEKRPNAMGDVVHGEFANPGDWPNQLIDGTEQGAERRHPLEVSRSRLQDAFRIAEYRAGYPPLVRMPLAAGQA